MRPKSPKPRPLLGLTTLILSQLLIPWSSVGAEIEPTEAETLFALKVQPLLVSKCFSCHGDDPDAIKGGLNLTTRDGMLAGGDIQGPAIVPGEAQVSPLYWAVTRSDPTLQMPPKQTDALTEEQTWWVRDWINAGAPWPDESRREAIVEAQAQQVTVPTSGGLTEDWTNRRYDPEDLWAYRPLRRPEVPHHDANEFSAFNPIDAFINRRLKDEELTPAPRADRRTLIRRATFDLLGLPPTPEQIDNFLNDPRSDAEAIKALVDRLLASPHYGERWGRHWLDVVRYADTAGFANDYERPNAWRYRDYVIRSFNQDKPYDQFIKEQLAGDEIDPNDPELLIAVGFLRMGPWEQTGMSVEKITRQQFLDDVTDMVGQVFLGHPLQCARCHDHKFDPIPTRDYYRVQAVFATTQFADRDAPFMPEENTHSGFDEQQDLEERIDRYSDILRQIREKEEQAARAWYQERGLEYAPRHKKLRSDVPEDKIAPNRIGLTPADNGMERIARKYLTRHRWERDRYRPIALSVYSGASRSFRNVNRRISMPDNPLRTGNIPQTAILSGGDVFSPTEPVQPGALSCVPYTGETETSSSLSEIPNTVKGRRLAFARWVASPDNPLTPRVMVNRIWQGHFGQGLVTSPNNFGTNGAKPSHSKLLDWMASEFIRSGWSIKEMHRLIMTSAAYARSSIHPNPEAIAQNDPKGILLARFQPRRLSAEEIRDTMLMASGELNPILGGVPIRPDRNLETALQPRMIMGTYAPAYQPSPKAEQRHRRSVYAQTIRGQRDPFLAAFNRPSPDKSCARRSASTVPTQALTLFNSQESNDRALAFADRLMNETEDRTEAVRRAFLWTTGHEPSSANLRDCLDHWSAMIKQHQGRSYPPESHPTAVERTAVDEITGESFTFTEELEANRRYEPDLHPSDLDAETRALADLCLVLFNANAFLYVD